MYRCGVESVTREEVAVTGKSVLRRGQVLDWKKGSCLQDNVSDRRRHKGRADARYAPEDALLAHCSVLLASAPPIHRNACQFIKDLQAIVRRLTSF